MKAQEGTEPPRLLNGWKDIACYLGKGVRTAQRYERELGLPVRRPAHKGRSVVLAARAELDAWVQASPLTDVGLRVTHYEASSVLLDALRKGVAQAGQLQADMLRLKDELHEAVTVLRETVRSVRTEAHGEIARDNRPIRLPFEGGSRKPN